MTSAPFIGGTSAAALAGVNRPTWAQPIDVYLELRGEAPPKVGSKMMSMGHLMEPVVADLFTEATGIALRKPAARADRTCSYLHPDGGCTATISQQYPWAGAHLDRWASDGATFEAKWGEGRTEWGPGWRAVSATRDDGPDVLWAPDEGTRVPLRYAVQVQHGLAVTGRDRGYLAVLLGYGDFRWYVLERDERMIANLMELEERFWRENYLAGVPPEPDGSEAYGKHLRRLYGSDDGTERVATPEQQALVAALREARRAREAAERIEATAAQAVQRSMGETAKLIGPGFSISYRQGAERQKVRWAELATRLAQALEVADWPTTKKGQTEYMRKVAHGEGLIDTEPGTRPFVVTFEDEEDTDAG